MNDDIFPDRVVIVRIEGFEFHNLDLLLLYFNNFIQFQFIISFVLGNILIYLPF